MPTEHWQQSLDTSQSSSASLGTSRPSRSLSVFRAYSRPWLRPSRILSRLVEVRLLFGVGLFLERVVCVLLVLFQNWFRLTLLVVVW